MNLTRQKPDQRQPGPLTGSERFNELFFCVLKRGADRIHSGKWQARTSNPDVQQGTAKAGRGQSDSVLFHSYRNASTGSSLDARSAGTSPLITPTTSRTIVESITVIIDICR